MSDDRIDEKLKFRGEWVVAALETGVCWPVKTTEFEFRNHQIYLRPETGDLYPTICMRLPSGMPSDEGKRIISHFLSSLSWVEEAGITVIGWTSGSLPHQMEKGPGARLESKNFRLDYLPDPTDEKT